METAGQFKGVRAVLPLVTFAALVAMSPAAESFSQASQSSKVNSTQKRRIVAQARLTGTREVQRVVTWQESTNRSSHTVIARFTIETTGKTRRTLWESHEPAVVEINSVRIEDLDGDGLPEVIGLWWRGASVGAALKILHWDKSTSAFMELRSNADAAALAGVHGYQIRGARGHRRIVLFNRATTTGWPPVADGEYELRGSDLVRVRGDRVTSTSESGIEGQTVISPARPGPVREGQTDTAPFKTTLIVWNAGDGLEVKRIETDSDGRFRVPLAPGAYSVGPPPRAGRAFPRAEAQTVNVSAGKFSRVTISFDSGMR